MFNIVLNIIFIFAILIVSPFHLLAHSSWIDSSIGDAGSEKGKIIFKIGNGHHFPVSEMAIGDNVINYCRVITPKGGVIEIKTEARGMFRVGSFKSVGDGCYIIIAGLKNPPRFFLKSILINGKCNRIDFRTGEQFEIIPEGSISRCKIGDSIRLNVYLNGKSIQSSLSISVDGKINFFTGTDKNGQYDLRIKENGKYLITSLYKGKGCSLSFEIR